MNNVLITNLYNCQNMGEVLQLRALVGARPENQYTLASWYSFVDEELCHALGVEVAGNLRPPGKFSLLINAAKCLAKLLAWRQSGRPRLPRLMQAYVDCDYVVDLGGDTFSDNPSPMYTIAHCFALVPALVAHKPYVICSQSIGPFRSPLTKALAKYVLNHARAVTARDPITRDYLVDTVGMDPSHVHLCRDLAYLLTPDCVPEPGVVGLNPSALAHRHMACTAMEYANAVTRIVHRLSMDRKVILIPHVYGPHRGLGSVVNQDDRSIIAQVADMVPVDIGTHADIGRCSLFVGFRMHACISAISRGIPTLALGYSQKSSGLPQLDWVKTLDIRSMTTDELVDAIGNAVSELARCRQPRPEERERLRIEASTNIAAIEELESHATSDLIGRHKRCAVGWSRDPAIRVRAASAGVATSLVHTALSHVASGSAVIMDTRSWPPRPIHTVSEDEVALCAGSAYAMGDNAMAQMLTLCAREEAVVTGLPCQVAALRARYPQHLYIGLFCSHGVHPEGIDLLLEHFGLKGRDVQFRAKANGTTGMLIDYSYFVPLTHYWRRFLNYCFIPHRCLRCRDLTAEQADVSVGDAWGLPGASSEGLNAIICRTERGAALLEEAVQSGRVAVTDVPPAAIAGTQRDYLMLKKGQLTARLRLYKMTRAAGNVISTHRVLHPVLRLWLRLAVRGQAVGWETETSPRGREKTPSATSTSHSERSSTT